VTPCDIIQLVTANERNSPHPDTLGGSHKQYHSLFSKKSAASTRFTKTQATKLFLSERCRASLVPRTHLVVSLFLPA
jgi:hypothetical protein